jgi:hypothetical protein
VTASVSAALGWYSNVIADAAGIITAPIAEYKKAQTSRDKSARPGTSASHNMSLSKSTSFNIMDRPGSSHSGPQGSKKGGGQIAVSINTSLMAFIVSFLLFYMLP